MTKFFYTIVPHNFQRIPGFVLHFHDKLIPVPSEFSNNLFSGGLGVRLFYPRLAWLGDPTHTLDIVNVTGLNKDYAALVGWKVWYSG